MEDNDFLEVRKQIRRKERLARKEHRMSKRLEENILSSIPSGLIPGNVGPYDSVAWPFSYTVTFDFGASPVTYGPNTKQTQSFQVTQEAAFICGSLSRKCLDGGPMGELSPLQLIVRDRQSTRQFMDFPIPLQAIAKKTPQTIWEVPLILMPSAFLDVEMTSWAPVDQVTGGQSSKISITFAGYRTRTKDIGTVLSTIFGRK